MFWNFLSWVIVILVVVAVFNIDKLPTWKKKFQELIEKNKKSKK